MKQTPLTQTDIKEMCRKFEELEVIKQELHHILQFGRQNGLFENMDDYCEAKAATLHFMKAMRVYKKNILKGAYKV